jgi:hypothetical protein
MLRVPLWLLETIIAIGLSPLVREDDSGLTAGEGAVRPALPIDISFLFLEKVVIGTIFKLVLLPKNRHLLLLSGLK